MKIKWETCKILPALDEEVIERVNSIMQEGSLNTSFLCVGWINSSLNRIVISKSLLWQDLKIAAKQHYHRRH